LTRAFFDLAKEADLDRELAGRFGLTDRASQFNTAD
jgi:hypothetical protein